MNFVQKTSQVRFSSPWRALVIVMISLPVFLVSCGKILDDVFNTELPPPNPHSNPAKGTFTAKIDGKSFTPIQNGFGFSINELTVDLAITFSAIDKEHTQFTGIVYIPKNRIADYTGKNIDLATEDGEITFVAIADRKLGTALLNTKVFDNKSGHIRLTQIEQNRISGEFEFIGESQAKDVVNITEGKFNMNY